jgi:menaquinone-dependent protoporphyrinogen oxidase
MKVLVAAASETGATQEIARALGEALVRRGIDATVARAETAEASDDYDALVVGSALHGGHWLDSASSFLSRSCETLTRRPVWLFSQEPWSEPLETRAVPLEIAEIMALSGAREHHLFAGELEPEPPTGARVALASRQLGTEIGIWAAEIGEALTAWT